MDTEGQGQDTRISGGGAQPLILSRHFWHHELIRLKFHNPAVSVTVDRDVKIADEAFMTVFFAPKESETSGTAAQTAASVPEKSESVSISHKPPHEILQDLVRLTKAEVVEPSAEDLQLESDLAEAEQRSKADRDSSLAINAEKKRQADLLAEARGLTA